MTESPPETGPVTETRPATEIPLTLVATRRRSVMRWVSVGVFTVLFAVAVAFGWWWTSRPDLVSVLEQGWQAYLRNDVDAIQRQMVSASKMSDQSSVARLLRGAFLLSTGEPNLALRPLLDASRDPALRSRSLVLAARAYLDLRQLNAAEQLLTECVTENPSDVEAQRLLAALYYDLGANPLAIQHLQEVARLAPTDARPLRLIALMRKDFQDYTAAAEAYREALRRTSTGPLAAEIRVELAQCLAELRQYEAALETLQPEDQSSEAIAVRLAALRALGRLAEARPLVDRAITSNDSSVALLVEFGNYFDATNDLTRASTYYEKAIQADPLDFVPRYKLSNVYARLGRKSDAEAQLEKMHENRKRYDRLHALQNKAMTEPQNANLRYEMGTAALELGRPELARVWFNAALGLDPEHQAARNALKSLDNPSPGLKR